MSFLMLSLIAVGLAMDALAVSIVEGIVLRRVTVGHTLRVSLYFGGFQGAMPILGWLAGNSLRIFIGAWDHWVAFGLLALVGGKMLADATFGFETGNPRGESRGVRLIALSLATSIDALAVGVTLAMLEVAVLGPALWIGLVTGALCAVGIQTGDRVGKKLGHYAEAIGGIILFAIGLRILFQHLLKGT